MTPAAIVALCAFLFSSMVALSILLYMPIAWYIRRRAAEREYQDGLARHSVYRKGGRYRV